MENISLEKKTRILCISPVFVPRADSESFCGAKLVMELIRNGIDTTVISLDPTSPKQEVLDDSELWRTLEEATVRIPTLAVKNLTYSSLMGIRYRTLNYARWIKAVVVKAQYLNEKKRFNLVYSRSLPMVAHICGFWIAQSLKLPWLANINDPWDWHLFPDKMKKNLPDVLKKNPYVYCWLSNYWMRKTLRSASLVTYPSKRLRDYHYRISGVAHKSEIIPHLGYNRKGKTKTSEFWLVHAGKLGKQDSRSSTGLLEGIKLFLKRRCGAERLFRMIFVGQEDNMTKSTIANLGLKEIVRTTGWVNYEQSLEYISLATVCVLVETQLTEGIFLPSKVADYFLARKPILALSPSIGVVADMVSLSGITRVDSDNPEDIGRAIDNYYEAFLLGSMDVLGPKESQIRQFAPETVSAKFCKQVQILLQKRVQN